MYTDTNNWLQLLREADFEHTMDTYGNNLKDEYFKAKKEGNLSYLKFIVNNKYNLKADIDYILWLDQSLEPEERQLVTNICIKYLYYAFSIKIEANILQMNTPISIDAFVRHMFEFISEYEYTWLTDKYLTLSSRKEAVRKLRKWCYEVNKLVNEVELDKLYFIRYNNGYELTICFE